MTARTRTVLLWFYGFKIAALIGLVIFWASTAHADPAHDVRIINPQNHHLFATLHPDGTYTCNFHRGPAEILGHAGAYDSGLLVAYYALCGERRP